MDEHDHSYHSPAEIRLTRFSSLNEVDKQQQASAEMESNLEQSEEKEEKPNHQLAHLGSFHNNDANQKWPWCKGLTLDSQSGQKQAGTDELISKQTQHQIVLDPAMLQEAADYEATLAGAGGAAKDFQVIWSQLAFEVDTRTYDQLLGRALDQLRSIVSCSSGSGEKHQQNPFFVENNEQLTQSQTSSSSQSTASIKSTSNRRVIFENLNGHIKSGEISAILGPSGAGKTSLINAICSKANANYRGQVRLIRSDSSRMRVSVIPQKDYLVDRLTVQENLLFASKILNSDKGFDHEANIYRLAKMLHLTNCLQSSTGSISGGEYKRVSIAQELLKRPDILILDEPTSGLDSVNCKNLIRSLRSLIDASNRGAINPIAIVLTIHQPDVEIFHMFDHIYCMARGGRTVYEGHPSKALESIQSQSGICGSDQPVGQFANVNPANLLIEIASEFVYGSGPIEKLNKFQLKQFEHQHQYLLDQRQPRTGNSCDQRLGGSWPSMVNHLVGGGVGSGSKTNLTATEQPTTSPSPSSFSVQSLVPSISSSSSTTATPVTAAAAAAASSSPPSPFAIINNNEDMIQKSAAITQTSVEKYSNGKKLFIRDKRLSSKVNHSGKFWRQMCLLIKRNFVADIRDPLVTGAAIIFHLLIPFVMWIAYSKKIGTAKACPVIHREMELLALASNETATIMADLQEEFTVALECSTMFFLSSYCFSLRSLSMAALSFPLSMHVLVKESRNGWYEVPAYVLARTISSFLTEVLLPVISVIMIYIILDMPDSPHQWRLWAVALVMALVSLISTVQGLIWGALSMDSVQTAIFMASASSLPLVMLSGFTARIKQMPVFMQNLSWISLYRYSSDSINMIRFGFGLCHCDDAMDEYLKTKSATFTDLPDRIKPLFTFYLTNNAGGNSNDDEATTLSYLDASSAISNETQRIAGISYDLVLNSTVRQEMLKRLESNELDLFGKMAELLSKSFTYGRQITGCESVRSQLLVTGGMPKDDYLPAYLGGLAIMFVLMNISLFVVVKSKVNKRI